MSQLSVKEHFYANSLLAQNAHGFMASILLMLIFSQHGDASFYKFINKKVVCKNKFHLTLSSPSFLKYIMNVIVLHFIFIVSSLGDV
jgi:hypothetical protein